MGNELGEKVNACIRNFGKPNVAFIPLHVYNSLRDAGLLVDLKRQDPIDETESEMWLQGLKNDGGHKIVIHLCNDNCGTSRIEDPLVLAKRMPLLGAYGHCAYNLSIGEPLSKSAHGYAV